MTEVAERRTDQGMRPAKRNGRQECPVNHARSINESCGALHVSGSRCDRVPHSEFVPHHCCGEEWEKAW
jgi:hypothetical protein